MSAPRLGLFLSTQRPGEPDWDRALAEHLEQVALARDLGYASVMAGQHFLQGTFQALQNLPLLARVAAGADGMTIGPGIVLLTLLNPVELAETLATLDVIAGGRLVVGVGIGYRAVENAAFGVTGDRGRLFEAKLDVLRRLLGGEEVTASGPGYALDGARLALTPRTPPPIWIAANADAAVARAARLGDAWFLNPHANLAALERQVALFREERESAGLPPVATMPIMREVCVAETDEEAFATARPYLERKYSAYVQWGQSEVLPGEDTLRREWDELAGGGRFVIGSPETCAAQLRELVERLGVDHVVCRFQWPGMPQETVLRSMRLLAREVIPALSAA
jgi:alkanesulfonate monooxygenase SsuD/methylene tetrahydromethanopterin reductase-like flavin-dependent oxidoreductase (luciferase family)